MTTTTKTYQSVLPATTRKTCRLDKLKRRIKSNLQRLFTAGFWFCNDCERVCERIEGEHGQPSHCSHCQGYRIEFTRPAIIEDRKLIQPQDLSV